ncbi:unnamed protein product, partial [Ectocarpus sp. 12 AP-2014]
MVRVLHHERPGVRSRRLVLRHLLDVSQSARRVGHYSIAQGALHRFLKVSRADVIATPPSSSSSHPATAAGRRRRRRHPALRPEDRAS